MDWKEARIICFWIVVIVLGLVGLVYGLSEVVSEPSISAKEAQSECMAANKRLGDYEFSYGHARYSCIDYPLTSDAK